MLPAPPVDHTQVELGKGDAVHSASDLLFAHYKQAAQKPTPSHFNLRTLPKSKLIIPGTKEWGMLANDTLGDCTQAARLHMHIGWSAAQGIKKTFTDAEAIMDYEKSCGYNPKDPATDQGGVEADVLKWWRTKAPADRRIEAYAAIEPGNIDDVKLSTMETGGCYLGLNLPISAQNQPVWAVVPGRNAAPGSWGGHAVNVVAFGPAGLRVVTWGYEQVMTYAFFAKYCDEAWAVIAKDWFDTAGHDPYGLDLKALLADVKAVTA